MKCKKKIEKKIYVNIWENRNKGKRKKKKHQDLWTSEKKNDTEIGESGERTSERERERMNEWMKGTQ